MRHVCAVGVSAAHKWPQVGFPLRRVYLPGHVTLQGVVRLDPLWWPHVPCRQRVAILRHYDHDGVLDLVVELPPFKRASRHVAAALVHIQLVCRAACRSHS